MMTATPDQADERAEEVGAIGVETVEGDSPEQRADDEDAAVGGKYAPELVAGLKGGDHAVGGQGHRAERDERDAFVVFDADPDEVGAADLGDGGGDEQRDGAGGHAAIVPAPGCRRDRGSAASRPSTASDSSGGEMQRRDRAGEHRQPGLVVVGLVEDLADVEHGEREHRDGDEREQGA